MRNCGRKGHGFFFTIKLVFARSANFLLTNNVDPPNWILPPPPWGVGRWSPPAPKEPLTRRLDYSPLSSTSIFPFTFFFLPFCSFRCRSAALLLPLALAHPWDFVILPLYPSSDALHAHFSHHPFRSDVLEVSVGTIHISLPAEPFPC